VIRIGIYGDDHTASRERHGCGLWPAGYASCVTAAGGTPILLDEAAAGHALDEFLEGLHGVILAGSDSCTNRQAANEQWLCEQCRLHSLPLLGVDHGLHALNSAHGGTTHLDVSRELPEALQHRHPPERGLRHAINVLRGTRLAELYGEGEVVVNSEHRRAVSRVARGFRVGATALDGVIEAIESESDSWFALGVQWHPASATASGLDIQLFRGLIEACGHRGHKAAPRACTHAA